jgi:putative sugar O-methyltransferase
MDIPPMDHSQWGGSYVSSNIDLRFFRGDNAYVYQYRDGNIEVNYVLTALYLQQRDQLGLLRKLKEDGLFGAYTFDLHEDLTLSRDLLDSVVQILFLERQLGISTMPRVNILDIGAGYGRLAHRMTQALGNIGKYLCVDAIAESTFISEYYLRFREAESAEVVPIFDIQEKLAGISIDLAVNVHSFPECTLASTVWWLELLRKFRVKYLLIIPNSDMHGGTKLMSTEKDRSRKDLLPVIESSGYKLKVQEPKFLDPSVQKHGVTPTYHYLFERMS